MRHLQREIDRLKHRLLGLGAVVEENLRLAIHAVENRDVAEARVVLATDRAIDETEVEIEEDCLKVLALYQPVAGDLRFVVTVVKVNNELERIGDLAVNIAERTLALADEPPLPFPPLVAVLADRASAVTENALDALVHQDAVSARRVLIADDEVDALYQQLLNELKDLIRAHPEQLDAATLLFSVARQLERLADHATNIAEDVLYLVEGEIFRHQTPAEPRMTLGPEN